MKVVQFKDGMYGIRRYDWVRCRYVYWSFSFQEWVDAQWGVPGSCKREWKEAEMAHLQMTDRGEAV